MFASVDPAVTEVRGVPVRALGIAFVVLLALTITMAVQVVGTLLLFALVVTPAATALRITARPARVVGAAVGLALVSVWGGLVLSAMFYLPPSFFIVSLSVPACLVVRIAGPGRTVVRPPHGQPPPALTRADVTDLSRGSDQHHRYGAVSGAASRAG